MIKWSHSLREHYYSVTLSDRFGLVPQYKLTFAENMRETTVNRETHHN